LIKLLLNEASINYSVDSLEMVARSIKNYFS